MSRDCGGAWTLEQEGDLAERITRALFLPCETDRIPGGFIKQLASDEPGAESVLADSYALSTC